MLVKNIEQKIKINKAVSIAAIVNAVFIVIAGFIFSYKIVLDSRRSIYVIDNGVPILVKQTDELLNRPVEYKSQVELFHRLFFTLAPDDKYIKENAEKSLYLIDDSGKKEYANLREKGFYNQIISSNSMVTTQADSIKIDLEKKKFIYYGKEMINRKSSVIKRKLITEGNFDDIIRSPNNPHGVILKNWRILDNSEISNESKYSPL
ncbi:MULTISPECIES: conjugative transposon protein TraK [Elizabethkingia]|uniref:Conjugative transposon protein TraK n=1 Tax=Elizabethkingia anophelis TaxID=1117645 RepID=A0A455ZH28_9FLAO|nr:MULTISPECIES: conjugative transposon protein TraK [Elizabethkingia]AQW90072.1 conjugative transposon protein TraK [Elizabethkingia anophelis]KUY23763.1 conjugal transfer protein TraK [Elizabethkingia anophelis]MCP1253282.1 conjugative transposon protein TraK [Elizabethkingia sp. S0634]DAC76066.1 TPA_exp: conjugative transposon protein TraK [Elizabethkingia anophelis]DAC76129.1 TPA_exp: conjugative transposon protein TraK [Elizabethkingia anophelis]